VDRNPLDARSASDEKFLRSVRLGEQLIEARAQVERWKAAWQTERDRADRNAEARAERLTLLQEVAALDRKVNGLREELTIERAAAEAWRAVVEAFEDYRIDEAASVDDVLDVIDGEMSKPVPTRLSREDVQP
jgi:hypothetical protein